MPDRPEQMRSTTHPTFLGPPLGRPIEILNAYCILEIDYFFSNWEFIVHNQNPSFQILNASWYELNVSGLEFRECPLGNLAGRASIKIMIAYPNSMLQEQLVNFTVIIQNFTLISQQILKPIARQNNTGKYLYVFIVRHEFAVYTKSNHDCFI